MPFTRTQLAEARRRWPRTRFEWTPAEVEKIRSLWGAMRLSALCRQMGRSPQACWQKAHQLRLGLGCPEGYEYCAAAARRTGYDWAKLREILRWAGVRLHLRLSYRAGRRGVPRHRYVDPTRVDEAVQRWLKEGPLLHARRKRG